MEEKDSREGNPKRANLEIGNPGGWHSRGYLPHFEGAEMTQHVTFHQADSLPKAALERMELQLRTLPMEKQEVERRKRVEEWVDAGHGSCLLRESGIASMVQGSFLKFDSERYRLLAWVVMPNHVHVLFQPMDGWTVAKIVASWKKFTARKICETRRKSGEEPLVPGVSGRQSGDGHPRPVWHREYWDRYIRDERHFLQAVEYIRLNPVKAGLVEAAGNWKWSSAYWEG